MSSNFHYHALNYLNQWFNHDLGYTTKLSDKKQDFKARTSTLVKAAIYYRVIRNFEREEYGDRLQPVLEALDNTRRPSSAKATVSCVESLRTSLSRSYPKDTLSASSKFLWLRYMSPVIIYDARAKKSLREKSLKPGDSYQSYCEAWTKGYESHQSAIAAACRKLPAVRKFTAASDKTLAEVKAISEQPWFHERVFDNYLWHMGG
jgi:lambda repressor-like predicted transcriptional regulator